MLDLQNEELSDNEIEKAIEFTKEIEMKKALSHLVFNKFIIYIGFNTKGDKPFA